LNQQRAAENLDKIGKSVIPSSTAEQKRRHSLTKIRAWLYLLVRSRPQRPAKSAVACDEPELINQAAGRFGQSQTRRTATWVSL